MSFVPLCICVLRTNTMHFEAWRYETHPPVKPSVPIANGSAGLDGPVINCVSHDYITEDSDPLYYIRSCMRVARGQSVTRASNALVRVSRMSEE